MTAAAAAAPPCGDCTLGVEAGEGEAEEETADARGLLVARMRRLGAGLTGELCGPEGEVGGDEDGATRKGEVDIARRRGLLLQVRM